MCSAQHIRSPCIIPRQQDTPTVNTYNTFSIHVLQLTTDYVRNSVQEKKTNGRGHLESERPKPLGCLLPPPFRNYWRKDANAPKNILYTHSTPCLPSQPIKKCYFSALYQEIIGLLTSTSCWQLLSHAEVPDDTGHQLLLPAALWCSS